jgi:hypothetical protein
MHHHTTPSPCPDPTGNQQGTTAVEVVIVSVLTAIILGIFYGSSLSVSSMTVNSNRDSQARARQMDVLDNIRRELNQSGMDDRFVIAPDGRSISYRKLIGAAQSGQSVSGMWSQTFTIERDPSGQVRRREADQVVDWGGGVLDLSFDRKPADAFIHVTCTTRQHGEDITRRIHVYPRN